MDVGQVRERRRKSGRRDLTEEQVCNWLKSVGLADCAEYFQEACVDGAGLVQLRELLAKEVTRRDDH